MKVYFRDRANNGKLAVIDVDDAVCLGNPEEATLLVQESLVGSGVGFDNPALALIHGGKQ